MKIKYLFVGLLLSVGILTSCEKDDPEVELTSVKQAAGQWNVTYKVETSPGVFEDIFHVGYTHLSTYNTAANTGEQIWVDDEGNFWDYKVKSNFDPSNLTLSGSELENTSYESKVTITDGKIILDEGRSKTGVQTDSIYFRVSFNDDDEPYGTIYHVSGHRVTGFVEDEF